MKKIFSTALILLLAVISASAQRIRVVDEEGQGVALANVINEDGLLIGFTDLEGVLADVKGAKVVAVSHLAYKPKQVTIAELTDGLITMEGSEFGLTEVVIKPKPLIYVETYYRTFVYRDDSLCYYLSGVMPNVYDLQKKKIDHGSYYQAYCEYCQKFGATITWGARAQSYKAGIVPTFRELNKDMLQNKYFVTVNDDNPNHHVWSNPEETVGHVVHSGGQTRMTIDGGKMQMYANKAKGETKILERRENAEYEYQFVMVYADDDEERDDYYVGNFVMESNHWEYNDKKSHVTFIIETYATDHYYMDKDDFKERKKEIKNNYKAATTLEEMEVYERQHNIPALPSITRQAILKLKN